MKTKNNIQLKILLILFFGLSNSLKAQSKNQINSTILFKITSVDSPYVSYIFGTHHAFGRNFFEELTPAKQALFSSGLLIKENSLADRPTASEIINSRSNTISWKQYLNKKSREFIKELFDASPTDYQKMTPAELFVFLNRYYTQEICLKIDGSKAETLDNYIEKLAKIKGKEIMGLETTFDQIKLINDDIEGMPKSIHKKRLNTLIALIQSNSNVNCNLVDWYQTMEIDYKTDQACSNSLILTSRNEKWLKQIVPKLKSTNCFIAVGLSHLMYECGLINKLKQAGFKVSPVGISNTPRDLNLNKV